MSILFIPFLFSTMETQLQALQVVARRATDDVNARGPLLADRLWDIPNRVREIACHGIHVGAATALSIVQVQLGHDIRDVEPIQAMGDTYLDFLDDMEELEDTATTIGDEANPNVVLLRVFYDG